MTAPRSDVIAAWVPEMKRLVAEGRQKARDKDLKVCPSAPYGTVYVLKHKTRLNGKLVGQWLIPDPKESSVPGLSKKQVVQDIFTWRDVYQMSLRKIGTTLNDAGILSPGRLNRLGKWLVPPGSWDPSTIRDLLKNRTYIGKPREAGKEYFYQDLCWIDEDRFERVQHVIAKSGRPKSDRPKYPFNSEASGRKRGRPPVLKAEPLPVQPQKRQSIQALVRQRVWGTR